MPPPPAIDPTAHSAADFSIQSRTTLVTWQDAVVAFGLGVNAAWILFLAYGVGKLASLLYKISFS